MSIPRVYLLSLKKCKKQIRFPLVLLTFLVLPLQLPKPSTSHIILLILTHPTSDFYILRRPEEPHRKEGTPASGMGTKSLILEGALCGWVDDWLYLHVLPVVLSFTLEGQSWWEMEGWQGLRMLPIFLGWERLESHHPVNP